MISVIIPSYNREKVLSRAVHSVMNQSYKDIEIIVVDDCSTDNTRELIKGIDDPRLRYHVLEKNSGACAARNKGIELAQGEFIAFQDSDDEWLPDKLEIELETLLHYKADIVFCSHTRIGLDKEIKVIPKGISEGFLSQRKLLYESLASTQTILGRAEAIKDIRFDAELPRMQDYDFIVRASGKYSIYFLNQPLVNVYEQTDSITASKRQYKKRLEISEILLNKHNDLYSIYPECEVKMLKTIAHCEVILHMDACKTLKEIYDKEKTFTNKAKIVLYRLKLLKPILKWTNR